MSQAASSSRPGASPMLRPPGPNTSTKVLDTVHGRILCIADIRGRLSHLNTLAREHDAKAVIHTGDFGFYEISSLERINDRTLKHLIQYSPLISQQQRTQLTGADSTPAMQRQSLHNSNLELLTEFPQLLSGAIKLSVPVFTVWGACEDVSVLEKFRMGIYEVENLHVLDEATTRCIDVGGVKLRLLGLGGALVMHKLFDNGDGQATIAGGGGTMWTTALQIGELVDTAQRVYDATETRLLVTHASPGRDGLIAQLALIVRADLTISGGLHFRYATSYNDFSVQGDQEGYRNKILRGKEHVDKVWESVKGQVEGLVDDQQRVLLEKFLSVVERVPPPPAQGIGATNASPEEPSWKNCWNWNLCDAAYGHLLMDIKDGRVSADLKSQGFNYAYRRSAVVPPPANNANAARSSTPQARAQSTASPVPTSSPAPATVAEPKTPASDATMSPVIGKEKDAANGHAGDKERLEQKKKERKEKEKEKKERQKAEREKERQDKQESVDGSGSKGGNSGKATPAQQQSTPTVATSPEGAGDSKSAPDAENPISPAGSTGARTPTSRKQPRNPWTLWMKLPAPATEEEVRQFFQDAKGGITKVHFPNSHFGRNRAAYVEFGDEEAMKKGLEGHAEKLKDNVVQVSIAEDRSSQNANFRGGRGGGRGGGFVSRNFAAAGLTRDRKGSSSGENKRSEPAAD